MENLNKDPGPVKSGCGHRLFIWRRDAPAPSQVAHVKCRDRQKLTLCPLRGVCVLFHINDKERSGSKKSLSYTHLFKKSQPHNTVGGSPQESSESWGLRQWQRTETTSLFVPETRAQFLSTAGLSPKPRIPSCISMGVFQHKERSTTA